MLNNQMVLGMVKDACRVLNNLGEPTTYENVARYLGTHKMALLKFIDINSRLIEVKDRKIGRTVKKVISEVYLDLSEKPYTAEWFNKMKAAYADCVRLQPIDNYGYMIGYDLKIDMGWESFMNSEEKVMQIVNTLGLKGPGWEYSIGGFGDCCTCKAKGYKVEGSQLQMIEQLGYRYITGGLGI